jgi:deazaflavin-dependent oxidoreductase (nitroreductase family)
MPAPDHAGKVATPNAARGRKNGNDDTGRDGRAPNSPGERLMAKRTYRPSLGPRLANVVFRVLARRARGKDTLHVLTVPGRKSGRAREIPVHIVEHGPHRYLVAIYGEQEWVRNVRANEGRARIGRGGVDEQVKLAEVDTDEAADALRHYTQLIPHVLPYLDLPDNPSDADWRGVAGTHPVFRVTAA